MQSSRPGNVRDWPLWWFARLEACLDRGDRRGAATALKKLEKLGIEVRFRVPPLSPRKEACGAAR